MTLAPTTPAAPAPATLGQATAIEQSRAVAEVQAAVLVAQHNRRSMSAARASLAESCAMLRFADTAFFRYPRGDKTISGPSVHMARELARCFRNVTYGIVELRRDDLAGESEMMAFAWDLEANTRSTTTFIVPHKRDVNGQMRQLTQLRDVYENNANMGARRVREMIFAILPPYFTSEAVELCEATLERGDGNRTLEERAQAAVDVFAPLGVTQDRLEQKLGRTIDKWTGYDLAQLRITHRSIERRELTVEDEFPAPRLTVADLTPEAPAPISEPPAAEPEATPETPDEPEATSETPAEPAVPVTGPELREIITVHKGRDVTVPKALRAVQAQFPDAGLVEVDAIAADPQALDWLLGWIDRGGK